VSQLLFISVLKISSSNFEKLLCQQINFRIMPKAGGVVSDYSGVGKVRLTGQVCCLNSKIRALQWFGK